MSGSQDVPDQVGLVSHISMQLPHLCLLYLFFYLIQIPSVYFPWECYTEPPTLDVTCPVLPVTSLYYQFDIGKGLESHLLFGVPYVRYIHAFIGSNA